MIGLFRGPYAPDKHAVKVISMLRKDQYNEAVNFAKSHGFDLSTMQYEPTSGPLKSNWPDVVEALEALKEAACVPSNI
ncbi:MAG TPA: hypothetical protein VJX16_29775 [Terriglobales bacterium]|nr:hypothetical protein [Terriglobales bacterium]